MKKHQPFILAVGLMCIAAPAFARWEPTYKVEGKDIRGGQSEGSDEIWPATTPPNRHMFCNIPSDLFLRSKGKVTVTFRWIPDGQPTPKKLSVFLESTARVSDQTDVPHSVDNGMEQGGGVAWTNEFRHSKKLKTYSVPESGEVEVGPFSLEVFNGVNSFDEAQQFDGLETEAWLSFNAATDTRSVSLSRANGGRDITTYENGVQVTRGVTCYSSDVDGVISDPADRKWAFQNFTASLPGNWSSIGTAPRVTWNWDISGLTTVAGRQDGKYSADRVSPVGGLTWHQRWDLNSTNGSPTKQWWSGTGRGMTTANVTYTVTDQGDGATATAKYILEIHEPIEKVQDRNYPVYAYVPVWGSGPLPGNPNGVMQPEGPIAAGGQNNPSVTVGHGTSQGVTYVVTGEFGAKEVGPVFGASAEWTNEQSRTVEQTSTVNIDVPVGFFTYPVFKDKYIRHHYYYRHFEEGGEHELPEVEAPRGSGLYDKPIHECVTDDPSQGGNTIVWAKPQRIGDGRVPPFTATPVNPEPDISGGSS